MGGDAYRYDNGIANSQDGEGADLPTPPAEFDELGIRSPVRDVLGHLLLGESETSKHAHAMKQWWTLLALNRREQRVVVGKC